MERGWKHGGGGRGYPDVDDRGDPGLMHPGRNRATGPAGRREPAPNRRMIGRMAPGSRAPCLLAVLFLAVLAGCPKESPRGAASPPPGHDGRSVAAPPALRAAPISFTSADLAPASLDWDRPVVSRMQLEGAIEDGDEALASARAGLGTFVVAFKHGRFDPYDAATGVLTFQAHGLEGMDLDPPVSFLAEPWITVGSLPGGGSVTLRVSDLPLTMRLDAAAAAAFVAADDDDPLITQYLMELGESATYDSATYVNATLHGVRVLRQKAGLVYLEGRPARTLR